MEASRRAFSAFRAWPWEPCPAMGPPNPPIRSSNMSETLTLSLSTGDVVIRLRPDLAPPHVERISSLAQVGFYDGVVFHRVIPGFMAQGGDPPGTGLCGSHLPDLTQEFTHPPHGRGLSPMDRERTPTNQT